MFALDAHRKQWHVCAQEFVRLVKSCKATMADRALALGALQTARADVAAKRSKLMKLRGTPGIRVRPPFD